LRRWLVVHGGKRPDQLVPGLLEQAMMTYFEAFYLPPAYSGYDGHDYLDT
jgi:hypothetical protein